MPALLLEWRETPDGWQGRVVRPVLDMEDGKWRSREEWLPATNLARHKDPRDGITHLGQ